MEFTVNFCLYLLYINRIIELIYRTTFFNNQIPETMKSGEAKNTYAIIKKEEDVKTLNHSILKNTYVLEIVNPFPGLYYGSLPTENEKPGSVILMLKDRISPEFFYRALTNAKRYSNLTIDAAMAELVIYNNTYTGIRIKPDSWDDLEEIQEIFMAEGFKFSKPKKIATKAFIKIFKFIDLEIHDNIYRNLEDPHFVFFPLEKEINWKLFEKTTIKIKNSIGSLKFDAALAVFFRKGYLEDAVRVYCKKFSDADISKIKKMYWDELKHY